MTPPIHKDWWLAAALTGAALPAAMGQVPASADSRQTGVITSVTQQAPAADASTPIYIDSTQGQRLVTGPGQTMHVLFSDQSAITVGPDSEVVITEYRYDPQTKNGNLLVDMPKGMVRVVGGFISKTNETVVRTGTAEVGIRGGITMVESRNGQTSAHYLFGQQMRVSTSDGSQNQLVTRQGFGVTAQDNQLSDPQRTPPTLLTGMLGRLETPNQGSPGSQPGAAPSGSPGPAPGGSPAGTGQTSSPPAIGGLANDRVAAGQNPNQAPNISPTDTLRNLLGTEAAPNQS